MEETRVKHIIVLQKANSIKDHYRIGKLLGKGCSSQVREGIHKKTDTECALKIIRKKEVEGVNVLEHLLSNEIKIL